MTTPRDLIITALERAAEHAVEPGDLSLALAAAEAVDLLAAGAVALDGGLLVPGGHREITDPLLAEAASALVRRPPYETPGAWLWRRGRGLTDGYLTGLEAEGEAVRERHRNWLVRHTRTVLTESAARRRAADRLAADEPVLAALTKALGLRGGPEADAAPGVTDPAAARVLATLDDALAELAAERLRRSRRQADAAAENVRRGY
ncbi:GPP34 family phosphoprotein [Actinacidiphila sp. bgisy160]|uniref:GPP34 family phosphoprotein n=1 Tax=Actinacidiphila sp. bgisy160 TaxID=3413796 RepID=UPI003D73ECC8